ncbi:hypothetical protein HPB52_025505 [Rhipicephalus sanguineus]|uniref:Uncharacterized protein n=1 Tax=Rhipicephalus sanguineus TaxID=34632 RepID=A0A9D4YRD5_RHISA|nr:hypothetical protein HPB52_025505 [Rhipicephalus sanguineus]
MKPKQGLIVRDFTNHQVARAVAAACGNNEVCRDEDILIRLRNGSNIIIASMPQKEAANRLRRITKLTLVIKSYEVNTYVATRTGWFAESSTASTRAHHLRSSWRIFESARKG